MTTRALIYGGIQITGIVTRTRSIYDGIYIEHRGSTLHGGEWQSAGISVEMNPHEALDLALCLIRAVKKHGADAQKSADVMIRRLSNRKVKP